MHLVRLTVTNFRSFFGTKTIIFAPPGPQPVTVVHGENGSGKTNLLNAMFWCLTGEFTPRLKNPNVLLNLAAYDEDPHSECSVELVFEHEGNTYEATRSQIGKSSKLDVQLLADTTSRPVANPAEFLERLIPRALSRWFFYDAEAIGELELSGSEQFRQSLRRILGFELVDLLLDDLDRCLTKKQGQHARLVKSADLQAIQEKIRDLEHVLPSQRTKAAEWSSIARQSDTEVAALEQKLRSMPQSRPLQEQRTRLERIRAQRVEELKDLRSAAARHIGESVPAILVTKLAEELDDHLHIRENTGRLPAPFSDQLVEDILAERICVCGRCVDAGSTEEARIKALLRTAATADFNARVRNVQYLIKDLRNVTGQYADARREFERKLSTLTKELEEIDDQRKRIREQLESIDEESIRIAESKRVSENAKAREAHQQHAVMQSRISDNEEDIAKLRARYDALSSQQGYDNTLTAEIEKIKRLAKYIKTTIRRQEEQALQILQFELNSVLERYLTKHFRAKINAKTYEVELHDDKGRSVGDSTGEGQVLKFAFITTVVALAAKKTLTKINFLADPTLAPLVLDAPFSALDPEYQASVARNLSQRTNQLVLFLSSAGWGFDVAAALEQSVSRRYALISKQRGPRGEKPIKEMSIKGKKIKLNEYGAERDETTIRDLS